jgi:hypothetical protein
MQQHEGPATISVESARRLYGVGRATAYAAASTGEIPAIRIGRRLRCPVARIAADLGLTPAEVVRLAEQNGKDA